MSEFSLPSDQIVFVFEEPPSGATVGVQIRNAVSDLVEVGRTTTGVSEQPAGSGIFVFVGAAPASEGDYLVIADWNAGVLTDNLSEVKELRVSATVPVATSNLGAIADAAKSHLASIFDKLINSPSYGQSLVVGQIETIKTRVLKTPPATADEGSLNRVVVDYLGKLVALSLIAPATALLQDEIQSRSTGNEPLEIVTYIDRLKVLQALEEILLEQIQREEELVLTLLPDPVQTSIADTGPAVSVVGQKVTDDPWSFPRIRDYPYHHRDRGIGNGSVFG